MSVKTWWLDFLTALQFLTRLPLPAVPHSVDALARAVKFFPLVGLLVGSTGAGLFLIVDPHLPRLATATLVIGFLVMLTGALHEDGLADAADGFGGGWTREQVLTILRDSRIGTYGAAALTLSLIARIVLLSSLPRAQVLPVLMTAHTLARWTTLPLSYSLPAVQSQVAGNGKGLGARIATMTSPATLAMGTLFAFTVAVLLLRRQALTPILAAVLIVLVSGLYFRHRIGGITGDCFGATNQLTEIAIYLSAVWSA